MVTDLREIKFEATVKKEETTSFLLDYNCKARIMPEASLHKQDSKNPGKDHRQLLFATFFSWSKSSQRD